MTRRPHPYAPPSHARRRLVFTQPPRHAPPRLPLERRRRSRRSRLLPSPRPRLPRLSSTSRIQRRHPSPRQGQTRHPTLHERRRQPHGHVRLQTRSRKTPRPDARPKGQTRRPDRRLRRRHEKPLRLPAARPVRSLGQQRLPRTGQTRRPHGLPHGHDLQNQRPRPRQLHDEHRLHPARFSLHGRMDHLRPRQSLR